MDNKTFLQVRGRENSTEDKVDEFSNDKYTAAIELSNKCREFYQSRVEAANSMKSRWRERSAQISDKSDCNSTLTSSKSSSTLNDNDSKRAGNKQKNNIDQAMETLRTEMASLMDQDLSLMKQLLTLNETIEDLKWQRQYYSCSTSCASLSNSRNLDSNWSVSDTEMYDSEDDFLQVKNLSSSHTGHVTGPTWHSTRKARKASKDFETISVDSVSIHVEHVGDAKANERLRSFPSEFTSSQTTVPSECLLKVGPTDKGFTHKDVLGMTSPVIHHDREQNSFDSGIHETTNNHEVLVWSV